MQYGVMKAVNHRLPAKHRPVYIPADDRPVERTVKRNKWRGKRLHVENCCEDEERINDNTEKFNKQMFP
jgi:hypothetical protein